MRIDPIEADLLYHFHPGAGVLRSGVMTASSLLDGAQRNGVGIVAIPEVRGHRSREILDAARACRSQGLLTIGSASGEGLIAAKTHLRALDAATIDMTSSLTPEFYRAALVRIAEHRDREPTWIELVVRLVPGQTDIDRDLDGLCRAIHEAMGRDVPVHFVAGGVLGHRECLQRARWIALANGLHWVYTDDPDRDSDRGSWCPGCDLLLVERRNEASTMRGLRGAACASCGWELPGSFVRSSQARGAA